MRNSFMSSESRVLAESLSRELLVARELINQFGYQLCIGKTVETQTYAQSALGRCEVLQGTWSASPGVQPRSHERPILAEVVATSSYGDKVCLN